MFYVSEVKRPNIFVEESAYIILIAKEKQVNLVVLLLIITINMKKGLGLEVTIGACKI